MFALYYYMYIIKYCMYYFIKYAYNGLCSHYMYNIIT